MEEEKPDKNFTVKRIGGYLHKIVPILDETGKVVNNIVTPFQVELKPRDIFQIIVGAYLLAVPVAFTEEVWVLSEELPVPNVAMVGVISLFFVSCFVYSNFYRHILKENFFSFIKRVVATYGCSLLAVALFLSVIQKCPWDLDSTLAIKRIILVSFPASMSATLSDTLK